MGFRQDIRAAIEGRLSDNWTATDVSWDNVPYKPKASTAFIRLLIDEADSVQISIANVPCHRITGIIHIPIMVPTGTGTQTAKGYSDALGDIFRNADFSDILCRSPKTVRVGDVGEHYQFSFIISFQADRALANAT